MSKFRIYHDGGDTEIFVGPDGKKDKNEFVFTGFGNGIHPYHKKEMKWIIQMLRSAGIELNLKEVPTVDGIAKCVDKGHFEFKDLYHQKDLRESKDGACYFLLQDTEMGRGWAVLASVSPASTKGKIITQDHRDNVRDWLLEGDWIRDFGIDYEKEEVKNLDKI